MGYQGQFARLFRDARKSAGLTQVQLAVRAKVGLSAVQTVESGRGRISTLNAILQALGLELRGRQLAAGPIGPALILARKRRKMSRRHLARVLGVSRNTLVGTEQGVGLVCTLEAYGGAVGAGLYLARPEDSRTFATHAGNSSGNNLWETPHWLAKAISEAVGGFDLDPCSAHADRRKARIKARLLLTAADDGLTATWRGKVFVNPPYARTLGHWVRKCRDEAAGGCLVVALIPARPDTAYWHDYVAGIADVFMFRGRLKFSDAKKAAPFPSAAVVWGGDPEVIRKIASALTDAWHVPSAIAMSSRKRTTTVAPTITM
jgi:transcriptional regulator with XRE-family HTH domain